MPPAKKAKATSLTKAQMAAEVAEKTGLTKAQAKDALDALSAVVVSEIKAGRPVAIQGLIKVTVKHQPARSEHAGRNPRTGEAITVRARPARKVVKVRALKALKDIVPK